MDLRTGKVYNSIEEAKAAGVYEADLVQVDRMIKTSDDMRAAIPKLNFPKNVFGSIKPLINK